MNNERFTIPEILFRPDDIGASHIHRLSSPCLADFPHTGLEQMGLAKLVAHVISLLPEEVRCMFWANIGLTGGSTKFPGFRDRL